MIDAIDVDKNKFSESATSFIEAQVKLEKELAEKEERAAVSNIRSLFFHYFRFHSKFCILIIYISIWTF